MGSLARGAHTISRGPAAHGSGRVRVPRAPPWDAAAAVAGEPPFLWDRGIALDRAPSGGKHMLCLQRQAPPCGGRGLVSGAALAPMSSQPHTPALPVFSTPSQHAPPPPNAPRAERMERVEKKLGRGKGANKGS